jgi:hypothetical protein
MRRDRLDLPARGDAVADIQMVLAGRLGSQGSDGPEVRPVRRDGPGAATVAHAQTPAAASSPAQEAGQPIAAILAVGHFGIPM